MIWREVLNLTIICASMSNVAVLLCLPGRARRPLSHTLALLVMWGEIFFIVWWGVFSWPFGYN